MANPPQKWSTKASFNMYGMLPQMPEHYVSQKQKCVRSAWDIDSSTNHNVFRGLPRTLHSFSVSYSTRIIGSTNLLPVIRNRGSEGSIWSYNYWKRRRKQQTGYISSKLHLVNTSGCQQSDYKIYEATDACNPSQTERRMNYKSTSLRHNTFS